MVRVVEELLESAVQHLQRMLDLAARAGDVLALNGLLLQPVVGIEQLHRGGQVVCGQAVEPGDDGRLFLGAGENAAHHVLNGRNALAHRDVVDGGVQLVHLAHVVAAAGDKGALLGRQALGDILLVGRPRRRLSCPGRLGRLALGERLALALLELTILVVGVLSHHEGGVLVVDAPLGKVAATDQGSGSSEKRLGVQLHTTRKFVHCADLALAEDTPKSLQPTSQLQPSDTRNKRPCRHTQPGNKQRFSNDSAHTKHRRRRNANDRQKSKHKRARATRSRHDGARRRQPPRRAEALLCLGQRRPLLGLLGRGGHRLLKTLGDATCRRALGRPVARMPVTLLPVGLLSRPALRLFLGLARLLLALALLLQLLMGLQVLLGRLP